jgi:hypothetical protein
MASWVFTVNLSMRILILLAGDSREFAAGVQSQPVAGLDDADSAEKVSPRGDAPAAGRAGRA